jgi:hypothetical protein
MGCAASTTAPESGDKSRGLPESAEVRSIAQAVLPATELSCPPVAARNLVPSPALASAESVPSVLVGDSSAPALAPTDQIIPAALVVPMQHRSGPITTEECAVDPSAISEFGNIDQLLAHAHTSRKELVSGEPAAQDKVGVFCALCDEIVPSATFLQHRDLCLARIVSKDTVAETDADISDCLDELQDLPPKTLGDAGRALVRKGCSLGEKSLTLDLATPTRAAEFCTGLVKSCDELLVDVRAWQKSMKHLVVPSAVVEGPHSSGQSMESETMPDTSPSNTAAANEVVLLEVGKPNAVSRRSSTDVSSERHLTLKSVVKKLRKAIKSKSLQLSRLSEPAQLDASGRVELCDDEAEIMILTDAPIHAQAPSPEPRRSVDTVRSAKDVEFIKDIQFVKLISSGGAGRVYLARKKRSGQVYAIKMMSKQDLQQKNMIDRIVSGVFPDAFCW